MNRHIGGRRHNVDGAPAAQGQPGPAVREDHHALDADLLAALAQEPLQLTGGLVELLAGRAAPAVGDQPLLDQVPVLSYLPACQRAPSTCTVALPPLPAVGPAVPLSPGAARAAVVLARAGRRG
jgi:hypothetical protein